MAKNFKHIKKYNKAENDDIAICLVHFNASGYIKPIMNNQYTINILNNSDVPYFLIELTYPNQEATFPVNHNIIHVSSNSIMFHKENLFNLLIKHLPEKYKKVICMDGDVLIDNINWIDDVSKKLDDVDVVMPYQYAYQVTENYENASYSGVVMLDRMANCTEGAYKSGYAIAFNRRFFDEIGLYEYAILGGGDRMTLCDFVGRPIKVSEFNSNKKKEYIDKIKSANLKFSYLSNDIYHLYHGNFEDRMYLNRHYLMSDLNIDNDIITNKYGILEFKDPSKYNQITYNYFNNRKEDN